MEHKDPVEHESDEKEMLTNGTTPEGGPGKVPICYRNGVPEQQKLDSLDAIQQDACQKCQKEKKKNRVLTFIVAVLVLVIVVIISAFVVVVQRKESPATPFRTLCPSDGLCRDCIHRGNWCYCSFDEERDWDFSRRNCSSSGTSFLTLDSEEDWIVIKDLKKEVWINLRREEVDQPWTWPNGSHVTQLDIKGVGWCAYVSGDVISSTYCDLIRYWICKKPVQAA